MNSFPWQCCCQVNSQTKLRHEGKQKAEVMRTDETHPGRSPALLLPSLVFSLVKKKCKNLWSLHQCSDCPCPSLCSSSSTSSPHPSRARRLLPPCTRTSHPSLFKWKPPDFPALPSSSLSRLTLLHSSSSQLSFPAGCLGTASPSSSRRPSSSHSSHPSLTFVCEPPASGFPSHTRTHTSALPALSSTFSFLACTQLFSAVTPSRIRPRRCPLLIFCFLNRCRPRS